MKKTSKILIFLLIILTLGLSGCGNGAQNESTHRTPRETTVASKTVKTLAVITGIDTTQMKVSFTLVENGTKQVYDYNVGTEFFSKSGSPLAAVQINVGDVADIYYNNNTLMISKIQISKDSNVWENSKVTSFLVNENDNSMRIGQTMYCYDENIYVVSNGVKINIQELNNSTDQLIIRGYKNKVVSIVVDKGHGYLSLSGEELFVGGLISVGSNFVRSIESGMLFPVTEGSYLIEVVNGDYKAEKEITINRGATAIVDFSDVAAIITETGNVRFKIDVAAAKLYLNSVPYDYSAILTLKTGTYKVKVTAAGYNEYTDTIEVKPGYQELLINLSKGNDEDVTKETTTEKETTEAATEDATTVTGETFVSSVNDVSVIGPEGGTVYFDGTYVGVAPVTFDMVTGTHVISILYNMEVKSYSVNLVEGADNVTYDFSNK